MSTKNLFKKILGKTVYHLIRRIFLFFYIKIIRNSLKTLEKNVIINRKLASIKILRKNQFRLLKFFLMSELTKKDREYISTMSKRNFKMGNPTYFGIFLSKKLIAIFSIAVR